MRRALGFDLDARKDCPTWMDALRDFVAQAEDRGVLVMCNGVVGNNNRRRLDPGEFRGFAMADNLAPLVFINGADSKAAQMFTLAHELAHIWLGESALSDGDAATSAVNDVERWCNRVAAEFLAPIENVRREASVSFSPSEVSRLARVFKVSSLVILRRLFDARIISRGQMERAYAEELARSAARPQRPGGNFYLTQAVRVSRRFARALVECALEGHTLYRDALRMLGISKESTFHNLARSTDHHETPRVS